MVEKAYSYRNKIISMKIMKLLPVDQFSLYSAAFFTGVAISPYNRQKTKASHFFLMSTSLTSSKSPFFFFKVAFKTTDIYPLNFYRKRLQKVLKNWSKPVCMCVVCAQSYQTDSLQPRGLQPTRLLYLSNFPGRNIGVSFHFLLQGIFLTQRSNPQFLHQQAILYHRATWEAT